jgi:TPR repeat protein
MIYWIGFRLRAFLFIFCASASADYQTGLDAYQRGDYGAAMSEWKAEVNQEPDPENLAIYRESLYGIAMLYWQGQGVEQDYSISAVWLKQAADINHPGAQTKLGYLYSTGQGVPQNDEEAVKWFEMAAQQGDSDARYNLDVLGQVGLAEAKSATAQPGLDAGEQWILAQDPEHYTIQVIALSAPDKLHDFIGGQPDWAPFAIYRQSRYKKPLWVMVQGSYADVDAAREAAGKFPPGIQKTQDLWIRKFGMVQRLIE